MACSLDNYYQVNGQGFPQNMCVRNLHIVGGLGESRKFSDHECFHFFLMECESLFLFYCEGL